MNNTSLVTLLVALLLPSTAFALADQCFEDDYAALPTTNCEVNVCQSEVNTYYQYASDNPLIVEAMDYCTDGNASVAEISQAGRDAIWEKFEYVQANPGTGIVEIAPPPQYLATDAYQNRFTCCLDEAAYDTGDLGLTLSQMIDTYSSIVAHALWLDITDRFPWKLTDYSEEELRTILDPDKIWRTEHSPTTYAEVGYHSWTTPAPPSNRYNGYYAGQSALIDNSPRDLFDVASSLVGTPNSPRTASQRILAIGAETVHVGGGTQCEWGTWRDPDTILTVKEWFSQENTRIFIAEQIDPDQACITINNNGAKYIARFGCNDRAAMLIGLHRSINIPAYYITGAAEASTGHSSFVLPTVGLTLGHADDITNTGQYDGAYARPYQEPSSLSFQSSTCYEASTSSALLSSFDRYAPMTRARCWNYQSWVNSTRLTLFCSLGFDELSAWCSNFFNACETSWSTDWKANYADAFSCSGDVP